ncbi:MAG TPA: SH3 domain-containing protein [Stellaceae bacterium]|nr:SH3 domain-containing protein [Stellaceae bacterium]
MSRRHMGRTLLACFALSTALAFGASPASAGEAEPGEKLPRFVSLRSDQVNLRVGPGENYPIQWVLTHKEMPVEIVKEFEHWRMIHDWQGTEGWVHERMVTGKRTVVVKGGIRALRRQPDLAAEVVARAEPGVFAHLIECRGAWCRIETADITGWVQRNEIWGVYPDEAVQ